jgi:hypothetical protein
MSFEIGQQVEKIGGDYGGPGIVVGFLDLEGRARVVVSHRIEGGFGRFAHIYSPSQLRPRDQLESREDCDGQTHTFPRR